MALFRKFAFHSGSKFGNADWDPIIENLNNVLNSRKGYASPAPDFGIRDLNEYTSRSHIASAVMEEVRRNIELYEPRVDLIDITIEDDKNPFKLAFKIECRVREGAHALRMIFDSVANDFHVESD